MPETPESHERIAKMQKDIEELRQDVEDSWHRDRQVYENMVKDALTGNSHCITLYLEIDGERSIKEIEENLIAIGHRIPHMSLWRASQRLVKTGLVRKAKMKSGSFVFAKKRWASALHMDDYVRTNFLQQ